jgi:hypothetical protein
MADFELPTTFSKQIENPRKYQLLLNKLAEDGFPTVQALKSNAPAVIRAIEIRCPGTDDKVRHKKRYFLSAIFWVLPASYRTRKTNRYYKYWQAHCLPSKDDTTDNPWVPRTQYNPDA